MTKGGGNWISACVGMTDKALFIRALKKMGTGFT